MSSTNPVPLQSSFGMLATLNGMSHTAQSGTHRPIILHFGRDLDLLYTRGQVLKLSGVPVEQCQGVASIDALLAQYTDGLLVLCHSLSEAERQEVLKKAQRQRPDFQSLLVARTSFTSRPGQETVCTAAGPHALLERANKLLTRQRRDAA